MIGLLGPPQQRDMFAPGIQAAIQDRLNETVDTTTAGSHQTIQTGRGLGLVPSQAPELLRYRPWLKCRYVSECATGGMYYVKIAEIAYKAIPTGAEGGALDSTWLAEYPADFNALYCNTNEIGKETHALSETDEVTEYWGQLIGVNSDNLYVLEGPAWQSKICPTTP